MRKISTFITCAIAANLWLLPRTEAKTIYYDDFNLCIPENVTVADLDALEPLLDMTENGFRKGEGWIWNYEADKNNGVASSMSCYTSAGKSDDWMILPAMSLDTEAPVIRWRARSCHKNSAKDIRYMYSKVKLFHRTSSVKSLFCFQNQRRMQSGTSMSLTCRLTKGRP